ncbi:hypothetical protein HanIR_Chr14g0698951 [Helianthus annuus]|nr:hypothetical protein HanIR_Chr14g0698951 [Helianthus annuus]
MLLGDASKGTNNGSPTHYKKGLLLCLFCYNIKQTNNNSPLFILNGKTLATGDLCGDGSGSLEKKGFLWFERFFGFFLFEFDFDRRVFLI